jgi:hypothetical protein
MACPRIENNVISQNKGCVDSGIYHGIYALDSMSCPVIIGNTIEDNTGLPYYHLPAGKFIYQGNVVNRNGYQAIGINGTDYNRIDKDTVWKKEDLPYLIMWNETIVDEGKTLTIEPGVVVKFMSYPVWLDGTKLRIKGNLIAEGTQDEPIVFTSMFDDSAAGKTINLDGYKDTQPYPGNWGGIEFFGGKGTLSHCCIQYGQNGLILKSRDKQHASVVVVKNTDIRYNSNIGVRNEGTNRGYNELVMEGCRITKNGWEGISALGMLHGTLSYNNIYNNNRPGMSASGYENRIVATNNWWGTTTPVFGKEIWWYEEEKTSVVYEPFLSQPWPNVESLIDHLEINPATITIGQGMKWIFNVGAYDRDGYLLLSPGGFRWWVDEKKGSLTVNDTMAVFQAGTRTGTVSITVQWGSLSTTAQVRVIESIYGTLSGTFAMRRDKEIWLMSTDGGVLREVSRDKTSGYPKLSRCGRYLAYGKQGYNEEQRSLFMCDLLEGIEKRKLCTYYYWDGHGSQARKISGWTFAPWEWDGGKLVYTPVWSNLFLAEEKNYWHRKFDQSEDISISNLCCGENYSHYPAMDDSGRVFGYNPDTKEIVCWSKKSRKEENKIKVLVSSIKSKPYPVISPDGLWMAYLNDGDIYITDTNNGLNNQRVTNTNRVGGPFAWSPDGQSLVYPQQDNGQWDLWIITSEGKYPKNITNTPNIDEDQVDWSPANIMDNMPRISRIGIAETEVAVVPNGSMVLKPCIYYNIPDIENYPMEYRIIGGMDLGTTTWRLEEEIGTLSSTIGREVVYYSGNRCGEGSLVVCWGSYTQSLRVVVAPSIIFPCIISKGEIFGGGYWWYEKDGQGKHPIMEVWIDGKRKERVTVGEEERGYPVRYSLLEGTHTIDVCFTNGRGSRDCIYFKGINIGSISLKSTGSLIYDKGRNEESDTWFDGVDLISDKERERVGYDSMRWTGALRFVVHVKGATEGLTKAVAMSQIITGLAEKVYTFPNPWYTDSNPITFVGVIEGARLEVYNIAGEKVFEKVLDASDVSDKKYLWKPENNDGQSLASGAYLYVVSYIDDIRVGKIGIVK